MKIVIPGGTGQIGRILVRSLTAAGHEVVVLSRGGASKALFVRWDGRTPGPWAEEIDGADAVINLAGRSVDCRYSRAHLAEMMDSRVDSTRAIGKAIERAARPPAVWLQMSTATIYAHRFDADTPHTRRVALRTAMVMSTDRGGVFDTLLRLVRFRLGGSIAGGRQYVSWIHERDFVRAVEFLLRRDDIEGPVNLAAPHPLPQREFMAELRAARGVRIGLPATKWMAGVGAFFLRTDTELILKSRRVVPGRLLEAGFVFEFPEWREAARDLVAPRDKHLLLYDGECGLCGRLVNLVHRRDRRGAFRTAPLQDPDVRELLAGYGYDATQLNTAYVVTGGRVLRKGRAGLFVLRRLGWPWSLLGVLRLLPPPLLDRGYDFIAARRHRLACPVPPSRRGGEGQ